MTDTTGDIQRTLEILKNGSADERAEARKSLITLAQERLRRKVRAMFAGYERLLRWLEVEDVLQNALIRLWKALADVVPADPRAFFGLAAEQIRRELLDMCRRVYGPMGIGPNQVTPPTPAAGLSSYPPVDKPESTNNDPQHLALWTDFHAKVAQLPAELKELFHLRYYQELTLEEIAECLGWPLIRVRRQWSAARTRLAEMLDGPLPF